MRAGLTALVLLCATSLTIGRTERIAAEITRLESAAPAVIAESSRAAVMSRLERARRALAAGQTYLALYDLQPVYEAEAGYRLAAAEKSVPDHSTFTGKWKQMGAPPDPPAHKAPVLFIEALAQGAEGRAPATYRASLPYAQDSGIMAGLYYLAESHAMVRFAALCRAVEGRPSGQAPVLRSIEPVLAEYENGVVKAYDAAPAAKRPQYAGVNVAIKLARSLDEQGRHEGAVLQYLVSRFRHAVIVDTRSTVSTEGTRERVRNTKMPPGADHSIGEFFLQLAAALLDAPDASAGNAAAILDDVLPAYFAMVEK